MKDQVPSFNLDAEQGVVGSMLIAPAGTMAGGRGTVSAAHQGRRSGNRPGLERQEDAGQRGLLTPGDAQPAARGGRWPASHARTDGGGRGRTREGSYGIAHWEPGQYEVDHLISLSLGGSNSKKNLWPQSYLTEPWNAHTKDQLEYKLLSLVRSGKVDLHTAQQEMARDWIAAYKKYVSPESLMDRRRAGMPARSTGLAVGDESARRDEAPDIETAPASAAQAAPAAPAASEGQVWVNTKSGVIWKPGTAYYGKTKAGKYMSEADALAAGYHDAK